jgi:hypothetical protein
VKILLDKNIDVRFKELFPKSVHEVYTVRDMKWNGIKNGELLRLLSDHGFNCWIVVDKNIPYQQHTAKLLCAIIVLDVFRNTLERISSILPDLLATLETISEGKIVVIAESKG